MMGSTVHLHVTAMGRDVVLVVSTMDMTPAQIAALANGASVKFKFHGNVCHVFNKETGINPVSYTHLGMTFCTRILPTAAVTAAL